MNKKGGWNLHENVKNKLEELNSVWDWRKGRGWEENNKQIQNSQI